MFQGGYDNVSEKHKAFLCVLDLFQMPGKNIFLYFTVNWSLTHI